MLWILGILLVVVAIILGVARTPKRSAADRGGDDATAPGATDGPPDLPEAELQDSIDLHGLPPAEVGGIVDAYVEEARRLGFRRVRIIHGRGIGALRRTVRVHLQRSPDVSRFFDAPPPSGHGATIAELHAADRDVAPRTDTH